MKPFLLILTVLSLFISCNPKPAGNKKPNFDSITMRIEPLNYNLIQVYPVIFSGKNKSNCNDEFYSLQQAMNMHIVSLTENIDSMDAFGMFGDVNSLIIENNSDKTVFVMKGEMVIGGKQDRIIAEDKMIKAHSGKTLLNVFCIEKERWEFILNNSGPEFNSGNAVVSNNIRKTISGGQSLVWENITDLLNDLSITSATQSAYAVLQSEPVTIQINNYKKYFSNLIIRDSSMMGMLVMSGSKFIGCDIFSSHILFRSEFDQLFTGYITDILADPGIKEKNEDIAQKRFSEIKKKFEDPDFTSGKLMQGSCVIHFESL